MSLAAIARNVKEKISSTLPNMPLKMMIMIEDLFAEEMTLGNIILVVDKMVVLYSPSWSILYVSLVFYHQRSTLDLSK